MANGEMLDFTSPCIFAPCLSGRRWQRIDPATTWAAKPIPGVYVIYLNEQPIYIGQSENVRNRFKQHGFEHEATFIKTPWGPYFHATDQVWAKVCYPKKYGEWLMLEARLIRRIYTFHNRRGTKKPA